jgi:hypothetical protein
MNVHLTTDQWNNPFPPKGMAIYVLVFKTNLQFKKDMLRVQPVLNNLPGILRWNVDRDDIDNVLRIETTHLLPQHIINVLTNAGYYCEELPD